MEREREREREREEVNPRHTYSTLEMTIDHKLCLAKYCNEEGREKKEGRRFV